MSMNVDKSYTTPDGNFYVGMTKDQAKQKGLYKKSVGMDFCDIDKNNDNVLSKFEIDEATIRQQNRLVVSGAGEALVGTAVALVGASVEIPSLGLSSPVAGVGGFMIINGLSRMGEGILLNKTGPGTMRLSAYISQKRKSVEQSVKQKVKSIFVK